MKHYPNELFNTNYGVIDKRMNFDGGAGSGNFGHKGVKGQRGGSAPSGNRNGEYEDRLLRELTDGNDVIMKQGYEKMCNYLCNLTKTSDANDFIGDYAEFAEDEGGYDYDEILDEVDEKLRDFVKKNRKEAKDAKSKAEFLRGTAGEVGIAGDEPVKFDKIAENKDKLANAGELIISAM